VWRWPILVAFVAVTVGALGFLWVRGEDGASRAQTADTKAVTTPTPDEFETLLQRPIRPPRLSRGKGCPDPVSPDAFGLPPGIPAEAGRGGAPVYVVHQAIPRFLDFFSPGLFVNVDESRGWRGALVLVLVDGTYRGPVLLRGGYVSLLANGGGTRGKPPALGFGNAATPLPSLRLPSALWRKAATPRKVWGQRLNLPTGWHAVRVVVRTRGEGCYFYQVDGDGFSHRFLFGVVWH
jgi:hypothetical protein